MNFSENIILENNRVRLEPLTMNHLNELLPISLKTPDLLRFSPSPFGNKKLLKINIQDLIQDRKDGKQYAFAIYDKINTKYVGSTSFGNISIKDQRLEIGWTWIDKESQGTGLNKQCKYLLLSHCFEKLSIERVEFKIDSRNIQSRKAIEKIGGFYEGKLRSHTLMLDGYRRDTICYSILRSDWKMIKTRYFINKMAGNIM